MIHLMHPVKPYKIGLGAFERFSNYSYSADRYILMQ